MKLIDTSILYEIISERETDVIRNSFILDLTIYEFGNAVWKQHKFFGIPKKECVGLIENFSKLGLRIIRINLNDLTEITEVAIKQGITVYDASYIFYAKKHSLELLTSDEKMKKAWEAK